MRTVEFFYDVVSPYSYLASTRIEAIAADCDAKVVFRPMFLGGLMRSVGNQPPATLPARGRYMLTDLHRWSAYYGIPFRFAPYFPSSTVAAMRVLVSLPEAERPALTHTLFNAYWSEGKDLSDRSLLAEIVGEELMARTADPAVKQALVDATEEAGKRGAFGAPTFFVDGQMYFGNDRLPFLEQALRS